jgi:hypothetical protein
MGDEMSDENDEIPPEGEASSSPLVEVKIGNTNIDLRGLDKFQAVVDNIFKSLARGLDKVYAPTDRVRLAKAERKALNERADMMLELSRKAADYVALQQTLANSGAAADRALSYLLGNEIPKLQNSEKIIEAVAVEVRDNPPERDASETIDDDWLAEFWSRAENTSNEQVQLFLARLLTKEIYQPGSISPLTLGVITKLSPRAAKTFEHFCRLSIKHAEDVFVIHPSVFAFQNIGPLDQFGVSFDDLYELEAYGLIRSAETIMYNYTVVPDAPPDQIEYGGQPAQLNFSGLQIHQIRFSRIGREIRQLLHLSPLPEYTAALREKFSTAFVCD